MTNEQLGNRLGVSHSMASRIRSGQRLPGTRTLGKFAREFDVSLEECHKAYEKGPDAFGKLVQRYAPRNGATA